MSDSDGTSLPEALRREYELMLRQLRQSRERSERLRELAEQAAVQVRSDERLLSGLAEVLGISDQATLEDLGSALRGHRLRELAVEVLKRHIKPGDVVHYRDWFALLREEGVAIAGKDPLATFLAQVSRSDAVDAVGGRTGKYRLRAVA